MKNLDRFRVVQSGEGATYEFPGFAMTIAFLATADDTDGAYSVFEAPSGLAHAFKCVGETTGKILFWMTPGGFEKFFAAAAEAIGSGPPDMKIMVAIGQEHDSDIVGPPIPVAE